MKQTTINRFREWAKTHSDNEVFSAGTDSWTKNDFEVKFLGGKPKKIEKPINIDVKEELNADLDTALDSGHSEES
nr:MAG TPA: hypothetical protein [Caudoviricetes sp.]